MFGIEGIEAVKFAPGVLGVEPPVDGGSGGSRSRRRRVRSRGPRGIELFRFQVVRSWLDRWKLNRSGKQSSPLDEIRPERWAFTEELLELLWVIEATLDLQPEGAELLERVCASDLFSEDELPKPSNAERRPPNNIVADGKQPSLLPE